MQWALLAVIVIGLFLISGRYPKIAFSALGALVFAVAALVLLTDDESRNTRKVITVEQVQIDNFAVLPAYAGSYRVSGRVLNGNADRELKVFNLNVIMEDCATTDAESCLIVGQEGDRVVISTPPGQARDFYINMYFGEPKINGVARWKYSISEPRS